jgi:hypothetical protein
MKRNNFLLIVLAIAGVVLAVFPVVLWIAVCSRYPSATHEQLQQHFYYYFPKNFQQTHGDFYLMLASAIIALIASIYWRKRSIKTERVVATVFVVLASVLTFLSVWQMM